MPRVSLPRILEPATRNLHLEVGGATIEDAVLDLLNREPNLKVHLFDEAGRLRPHVLCFIDGDSTRLEDRTKAVTEKSSIVFVQAVSGG